MTRAESIRAWLSLLATVLILALGMLLDRWGPRALISSWAMGIATALGALTGPVIYCEAPAILRVINGLCLIVIGANVAHGLLAPVLHALGLVP